MDNPYQLYIDLFFSKGLTHELFFQHHDLLQNYELFLYYIHYTFNNTKINI